MTSRDARPMPGPGQESVSGLPATAWIEPTDRRVRVLVGGVTVADTTHALRVLETASPRPSHPAFGRATRPPRAPAGHTVCEWKGEASYWSIQIGERVWRSAAWSYPEPKSS